MSLVDEQGRALAAQVPKAPVRVTIAIPARDTVATNFMYDLTSMVAATSRHRRDIELRLVIDKGTILPSQRHRLVQHARAADSTHILWLDADHRFPKDTLVRLLEHDVDIVAANYVERRLPPRPVAFLSDESTAVEDRLYTPPEATGLVEVKAIGMGVMLTKLGVFAMTPAPWFQFGWHTEEQDYIGEDTYFARKAREAGFTILVDQDLSKHVRHVGEFEFTHEHALAVKEEMLRGNQ